MRLRHRVLVVLTCLWCSTLMLWLLLGRDLLLRVSDLPEESSAAVVTLLTMAAAAVGAVAIGGGLVAMRLWVTGPVEQLVREEAQPGGDEITALRSEFGVLRQRAKALEHERRDSLDAVEALLSREMYTLAQQDRMALTGQLALGAFHELGGPLTVAMGCGDSLPPDLDPQLRAALNESLDRIASLLREINDFGLNAPLEGGDAVCEPMEVLAHTAALARMHRRCRQVSFVIPQLDERDEPAIQARARIGAPHLAQVVLNLLVNGADATDGEGTLTLTLSLGDAVVTIDVDDDGPGVPPDRRAAIFEPFVTSKGKGQGSGLGLDICRRLIQRAGGTIELLGSPTGGARFRIALPRVVTG